MKLFGILTTVGLANADFMSVFDAHDSVSIIAESLFQEITEHFPFENINGKILACLYNINDLSLPSIWACHQRIFDNYSDKPKIRLLERQLNGKILSGSRKALENNPGSSGPKKRRCAKPEQFPVTDDLVSKITSLETRFESGDGEFSDALVSYSFYGRTIT